MPSTPDHAVLLLRCPDQQGVVAATAEFIAAHNGNIIHAEQHVDETDDVFFQRVEFDLHGFAVERHKIIAAFAGLRDRFSMNVGLHFTKTPQRVVILASKQAHCLYDLLTRWRTGELRADLRAVICNHPDHAEICQFMGVPYDYLPVDRADKAAQQAAVLERLHHYDAELVVLARYMQILPPTIVDAFPSRIINIHHSFLPAFIGANPYRQAYDR
ncbi:MAG TPA: formyltetrahydrofolate deformylase, partial [Ilumatobacteraceae bacterium]|nr:formyltetrahydrofolate deformylase [Ilumatobacteraceae bacterium]